MRQLPFTLLSISVICPLLQTIVANPLNRVNDENLPDNYVFHSFQFADTDAICTFLNRYWIEAQDHAGARTYYGEDLPLVVSSKIKNVDPFCIEFWCRDFRTENAINSAVLTKNEVLLTGPYQLHCNPQTEIGRRRPKPPGTNSSDARVRSPGHCAKTSSIGRKESSVRVAAGTSNCVDIASGAHAAIEAYLMDDKDGFGENVSEDAYSAWMNLLEIGSSRHEYAVHQNFVSMESDSTSTRVYRACAKMQPGHGNGKLFLFSTLQS